MSANIGKTRLAYSRTWHLVDIGASPLALGRIASQIAITLMGKHKPIYDPSTDCGDYVVAVGCADLHVTGKKREQKMYYKQTTRPGSLRAVSMDALWAKWGGGEVLRRAVKGMLPKNRLREDRIGRLKAFEGLAHPYKANLLRFKGQGKIREGSPVRESAVGMPRVRETFKETFVGSPLTSILSTMEGLNAQLFSFDHAFDHAFASLYETTQ